MARVELKKERQFEAPQGETLDEMGARLEAQVEEWFAGPSEEMGEEEWAALLRGEYRYPPEEDSWAVPPGWKSPR